MYFVPLLLGIAFLLAYPSLLLAAAIVVLSWVYLAYGGTKVSKDEARDIRAQIAYRVLCVKVLAISGQFDDLTYEAHALYTTDFAENAGLRGKLRDCAGWRADGWEHSARVLRTLFRSEPDELSKRMTRLIVQISVQPGGTADATQARLVEIAKLWKLGPKHVRALFEQNNVEMSAAMLAWR